ncbi:MAG: hypothetical protein ACRDOM_08140 [Nocardioides sp.]
MTTTTDLGRGATLRPELEEAAHTLARLTLVGAAGGILAVGILGRLAMFLLAELNPIAHGTISDDGFPIGEFTIAGSLGLAFVGAVFGALGAGFYVGMRGLMTGPAWFRLLSISLGPGVVVGALLAHTDGVDFTRLDPPELAVALFVAVPTIYAALLHLGAGVVEHRTLPRPLVVLATLPWVFPFFPVGLLLLATFLVRRRLRQSESGRDLRDQSWPRWVARAALTVLFVWAVLDLRSDLTILA